jgi:GntR family transcriptional regulator/MocR family aminotransferase
LELTLSLDAGAERSLQVQIFEQVRSMILGGQLKAGMALPPSRLLAERVNVSRNTVTIAYDRLVAEGYVESRGTAGRAERAASVLCGLSGRRQRSSGARLLGRAV